MFISISDLLSYFDIWLSALTDLWEMFNTRLGPLVADAIGSGHVLLAPVYSVLVFTGLDSFTLLGAMIGGGLIFYVVYQFIMWLFNLIT